MLYIVATPIGNLGDFSFRAVETLQRCSYILCEDTRHSLILLQHYQIKKRLESYHQFNEQAKLSSILLDLQQGQDIALLSDGGTPLVCDPGHILLSACRKAHIPVTAIPGPCAFVTALLLSGFPAAPSQFLGFLPKKESEILALAPYLFSYPGTSLCYESPQRLPHTLALLAPLAPSHPVAIARELTKNFEEVRTFSLQEAALHFHSSPPKGEIVLLFGPGPDPFLSQNPYELTLTLVEKYNIPLATAIKTAAHLCQIPKQEVYSLFHK